MTSAICESSGVPQPEKGLPAPWQEVLRRSIRSADDLREQLGLPPVAQTGNRQPESNYPLLVPETFLARIPPGEPAHPLLRQVMPTDEELAAVEGFTSDPVGDANAVQVGRLLKKYAGRVLLMSTPACGVHCRFCFRRHFREGACADGAVDWNKEFARIAADPSIGEVILSGGDPLVLEDDAIEEIVTRAEAIEHVTRLRIHSRMPIVIPQRITGRLLAIFQQTRLAVVFVAHVNHPLEIGPCPEDPAISALKRLVDAGIPTLAQGVLLRGVNDSVATLVELFQALVNHRVMPYYLHQLDHVVGAAHFAVDDNEAIALMRQVRTMLPGYAVPRLVREIPGEAGKTVLA